MGCCGSRMRIRDSGGDAVIDAFVAGKLIAESVALLVAANYGATP